MAVRLAVALLSLLCTLATAGCGSPCTRIRSAEEDLNGKRKPCGLSSAEVTDAAACETGLGKCTDGDREALDKYADCLGSVPECAPGADVSFGLAVLGCLQPIAQARFECLSATGLP